MVKLQIYKMNKFIQGLLQRIKFIPIKPSHWKLYKHGLDPQSIQFQIQMTVCKHTATNHVTTYYKVTVIKHFKHCIQPDTSYDVLMV